MKNAIELNEMELNNVNGAGFWDDMVDFVKDTYDTVTDKVKETVKDVYEGAKNGVEEIVNQIKGPVTMPGDKWNPVIM